MILFKILQTEYKIFKDQILILKYKKIKVYFNKQKEKHKVNYYLDKTRYFIKVRKANYR